MSTKPAGIRGRKASPLLLMAGLAWVLFSGISLSSSPGVEKVEANEDGYVGRQECARCHEDKGADHFASNHAGTWLPVSALDRMPGLPQEIEEGPLTYRVDQMEGRWSFSIQLPGRPAQVIPIHSIMGGERFGFSFILRANKIEGRELGRPSLVEARYMLEAGTHRLKQSPGLFDGLPGNYNTAVGRVMSLEFERRCLECHTGPIDDDLADAGGPHPRFLDTGVGCERCHGAGAEHVAAAERDEADLKIVHPGKLSNRKLMELCSQCHNGFFPLVKPRPQDVLISNQVTALENSECYIQSDAGFSCLDCHDPHLNARKGDPSYQATCLGCHSQGTRQAVICPVNATSGCIGCHMPESVEQDNFHLTDHWIRVRE